MYVHIYTYTYQKVLVNESGRIFAAGGGGHRGCVRAQSGNPTVGKAGIVPELGDGG